MTRVAILAALLAAAGVAGPPATQPAAADAAAAGSIAPLSVPPIEQAPERCGPAALAMVLRYYGADPAAVAQADSAYDPALRGALVTDLAAAARRAGFEATSARIDEDSLRSLVASGVPPILLYHRGVGPIAIGHYGVVIGWDAARERYAVNDGGRATRHLKRGDLMRRWRAAGSLALVVRRGTP